MKLIRVVWGRGGCGNGGNGGSEVDGNDGDSYIEKCNDIGDYEIDESGSGDDNDAVRNSEGD